MTDRRPVHLAVLVGVSAGAYAVSLAGVTALQSASDTALNAEREPYRLAADVAGDHHTRLEAAVDEATRRYLVLAARYDQVAPRVEELDAALEGLSARADAVNETARSLKTRISLPTVRSSVPAAPRSRPKTQATTGASG